MRRRKRNWVARRVKHRVKKTRQRREDNIQECFRQFPASSVQPLGAATKLEILAF
jgi:hypothetical protein